MTKPNEFSNSVDPDEVAHHEPPHQDLHSLNYEYDMAWTFFLNFAEENFVVCFLALKELKTSTSA